MSFTNALIQDWIMLITGYDDQHVIRSDQNGPRPDNDYATYKMIAAQPSDYNIKSHSAPDPNDDVLVTYKNRNKVTVSVNIYASDGLNKLSQLGMSSELLTVRLLLQAEDVALVPNCAPRNLNFLDDTDWKPRDQADFMFLTFTELTELNQLILEYEINGKWNNTDVVIIAAP